MFHYFNDITNGDVALPGYFVRVLDTTTGDVIAMAADNGGTPIETVSGVANMCKTDSAGNASFYVAYGAYNLDIYAPDAATFVRRIQNVDMGEAAGLALASVGQSAANAALTAADRVQTGLDRAATGADRVQVASDRAAADSSAALASLAAVTVGLYSNGAATNVPRGLTQAGVGAITAGSGGTNGTFALGWSGGNFSVNPTGTFTVAGGALTAVTITGPGLYIGASATVPTPSFSASAGLTGAAVALTAQFLVASGVGYFVQSADGSVYNRYYNSSGTATQDLSISPIPANPTVSALIDSLATYRGVVGRPLSATLTAATATGAATYLLTDAFASATTLRRLRIFGGSAGGVVRVVKGTLVGTTWTRTGFADTASITAGIVNNVPINFPVAAGEIVGISVAANTFPYNNAVASDGSGWRTVSQNAASGTAGALQTTGQLQFGFDDLPQSVTATAFSSVQSSIATLTPTVAALTTSLSRPITFGATSPKTGTVVSSGIWVNSVPSSVSGTSSRIILYSTGSGTVQFKRFTKSGSNWTQIGSDIALAVVAGVNTFVSGVDFTAFSVAANDYFGFFGTLVTYTSNAADGVVPYFGGNSNVSSFVQGSTTGGVYVQLQVEVSYIFNAASDLAAKATAAGPPIIGTNYDIIHQADTGGIVQLKSLRKSDGLVTTLTPGQTVNSLAGSIDSSDNVYFEQRNGSAQIQNFVVPAAGGTIVPYTASADLDGWGDSLTAYVQDPANAYLPQLVAALGDGRAYTNDGLSGDTSTGIKNRFLAATATQKQRLTIIWAGRNNFAPGNTVAADIATIVAGLNQFRKRFIVMSIINGDTEPSGSTNYNNIAALNAVLASAYPNNYVDIRAYIIANGLSDNGLTPTATDLTNISQDIPPASIRLPADFLHGNQYMYFSVAKRLKAFIQAKGW